MLLLSILFCACNSTSKFASNSNRTEQVFIANQSNSLSGKCYTALKSDSRLLEILCPNEITKKVIQQLHADLIRLSYSIDAEEIDNKKLGTSTKKAIKAFQDKNKMTTGFLDWATVNRLRFG